MYIRGRIHTSTFALREVNYTYYHQDTQTDKIGSEKCSISLSGPDTVFVRGLISILSTLFHMQLECIM